MANSVFVSLDDLVEISDAADENNISTPRLVKMLLFLALENGLLESAVAEVEEEGKDGWVSDPDEN